MANPAAELADLLETWGRIPNGTSIYTVRGSSSNGRGDVEMWRRHLDAVALLAQVDQSLRAMELSGRKVDHHVRAFPLWCEGMFAPNELWNQISQGVRESIDATAIDRLHSFADFLGSTEPGTMIGPAERLGIREAVGSLIDLLGSDEVSLDDSSKRYIFELLSAIQRLADEHLVTGTTDLVRRINELYGALSLLADDLSEAGATPGFVSKLRSAARRVYPYAHFGVTAGLAALGAAADVKAVTGG
jgi:hypothetical protein